MYRYVLTLLCLLNISNGFSQRIEKVFLDKNDSVRNCYTVIHSASLQLEGYMFLVPGFGETSDDVFTQTQLPIEAAKRGIMTIIPTFQDGTSSFGFDEESQVTFQSIMNDVVLRYDLEGVGYFLGGFSMGGSAVIKFAETRKHKPLAVFAIDSPLDFERFYYSTKRDIEIFRKGREEKDNIYLYLIRRIEELMGGSPQTALKNYHKISPNSLSDTSQTAIKGLINVPVRIYIEPDIQWWLNERGTDVFGLNILDCSAMINELRLLGNNDAELIITHGKGFRQPTNKRHPHSWSIVDNDELLDWLLKQKAKK